MLWWIKLCVSSVYDISEISTHFAIRYNAMYRHQLESSIFSSYPTHVAALAGDVTQKIDSEKTTLSTALCTSITSTRNVSPRHVGVIVPVAVDSQPCTPVAWLAMRLGMTESIDWYPAWSGPASSRRWKVIIVQRKFIYEHWLLGSRGRRQRAAAWQRNGTNTTPKADKDATIA